MYVLVQVSAVFLLFGYYLFIGGLWRIKRYLGTITYVMLLCTLKLQSNQTTLTMQWFIYSEVIPYRLTGLRTLAVSKTNGCSMKIKIRLKENTGIIYTSKKMG